MANVRTVLDFFVDSFGVKLRTREGQRADEIEQQNLVPVLHSVYVDYAGFTLEYYSGKVMSVSVQADCDPIALGDKLAEKVIGNAYRWSFVEAFQAGLDDSHWWLIGHLGDLEPGSSVPGDYQFRDGKSVTHLVQWETLDQRLVNGHFNYTGHPVTDMVKKFGYGVLPCGLPESAWGYKKAQESPADAAEWIRANCSVEVLEDAVRLAANWQNPRFSEGTRETCLLERHPYYRISTSGDPQPLLNLLWRHKALLFRLLTEK